MECLNGKATSYNLLEGIYANAIAHEVERLCVDCKCSSTSLSTASFNTLIASANSFQTIRFD
jgi:hypothetical protein